MDSTNDDELSLSQQLFNLQLDLEKQLKSKSSDNNTTDEHNKSLVFSYLDNVLNNKLILVEDFGHGMDWLNVGSSDGLSLRRHLNGLIVVMDFFTYCCINCLHILPKLKTLETDFESEPVVVIGIHSPKFANEKDITNVCDAVLKYDITHPVVNDPKAKIWSAIGVQCWPTLVILGPNAQILFTLVGETGVEKWLHFYTQTSLQYFKQKKLIINENKSKIPVKLLKHSIERQILGFPAKINVSEDQQLIAISNAKYNNIIIATINGVIKHIIGGNEPAFQDGSFSDARFNGPNGVVWRGNHIVYVADTENHSIREINLNEQTVTTIVGNGRLTSDRNGGGIGRQQGLNSPWDLCLTNNSLFIAMAGCHQIWVLILEDNTKVIDKMYSKGMCFSFAGNGAEENRNNSYRHKASFAQPSGLALDVKNNCIFVADSESSSIRCVDITKGNVTAVVGGDRDPRNLFAFGDKDGKGCECRLQHCLAVTFDHKNHCLFVADSYNHKIKRVDLSTKQCVSIAGTGVKGNKSQCKLSECSFNEPNGLCLIDNCKRLLITDTNNHCLKLLDLDNDLAKEFNLTYIKDNRKLNSDKQSLQTNADFVVKLNAIDLWPKSELRFKLSLNFGQHLKFTEQTNQIIRFQNPDDHLFLVSHDCIDSIEQITNVWLKLKDLDTNECLNKIYLFKINANFNLCHNELNYCKQVLVEFDLPLRICDNSNKSDTNTCLIACLDFTLN